MSTLPSPSSGGCPPPGPVDGDVLIAAAGSAESHTLAVLPSSPQLLCETAADAVRQARRFATRYALDAWLADEDGHYSRVSHHRRATRSVSAAYRPHRR
jgi:hypothetical protein